MSAEPKSLQDQLKVIKPLLAEKDRPLARKHINHSIETKQEVIRLYKEKLKIPNIAKRMGLSPSVVYGWVDKYQTGTLFKKTAVKTQVTQVVNKEKKLLFNHDIAEENAKLKAENVRLKAQIEKLKPLALGYIESLKL